MQGISSRKSVVSSALRRVEREEQERVFEYPLGTVLYTVEFGDGTDTLVPESDLRLAD
jgi:hypothetical protein